MNEAKDCPRCKSEVTGQSMGVIFGAIGYDVVPDVCDLCRGSKRVVEFRNEMDDEVDQELDALREEVAGLRAEVERLRALHVPLAKQRLAGASALLDAARRAQEAIDGIKEEFDRTVRHHESKGRGGMQVPFHGDFASSAPSAVGRMRWWSNHILGPALSALSAVLNESAGPGGGSSQLKGDVNAPGDGLDGSIPSRGATLDERRALAERVREMCAVEAETCTHDGDGHGADIRSLDLSPLLGGSDAA